MKYHTIIPPSSKSYSHRYIFGAFLSKKMVFLNNILDCDDIRATKEVLQQLGFYISHSLYSGEKTILVDTEIRQDEYILHTQGSATLSRFLSCLLAIFPQESSYLIQGSEQLQERSHELSSYYASLLNMDITYHNQYGHLPYTLRPQGFIQTEDILITEEQSSSQYLSGLLFALSLSSFPRNLYLYPATIASFPYVCSTIFTLQEYGLDIACFFSSSPENPYIPLDITSLSTLYKQYPNGKLHIHITPSPYTILQHTIPSDFSAIAYLLCFGIFGEHPISIPYSGIHAPQADIYILDILRNMGAHIEDNGSMLTVYPSLDRLHAIDIDMSSCPDLFPPVAILQAFARGHSRLYNIEHIRSKESNRVHAMLTGLYALGFDIQEEDTYVDIRERIAFPPTPVALSSFNDHRIAMAFSLCNIIQKDMCTLDNYQCVSKSFPHYWDIFHNL